MVQSKQDCGLSIYYFYIKIVIAPLNSSLCAVCVPALLNCVGIFVSTGFVLEEEEKREREVGMSCVPFIH